MDYILRTCDLEKKYKGKIIVDNININVKKGEIYALIGKRGAGKTTTIKLVLGLIKPTNGYIELFGEKVKPGTHKHLDRIGSIVEVAGFYTNLTAYENLDIHRRIMGIPNKTCIDMSLEVVGLSLEKNKKVGYFSLGMKQRLGIARALLYQPEFLILDEPINGVDPMGIKEIRELIIGLSERRGMTILMTSHILSEVQQISATIGIINQGKLIEEISNEELQKKKRQYIQIKVANPKKATFVLEQKMKISDYSVIEPGIIRIYNNIEDPANLNRILIENNVELKESVMVNESLEDYFMYITGGDLHD